jgi:hypothetical protein
MIDIEYGINKIVQLAKENLLWDIIVLIFTFLLGAVGLTVYKMFGFHNPKELVQGFIKARKTSKILLHCNRPNFGGGLPTHFADRFIDIWCSSGKNPLRYGSRDFYSKKMTLNARFHEFYIDNELEKLGLIEIDHHRNIVKPVKKWPNDLIYNRCKTFLIKYAGDTEEYYRNLEQH